MAKARVETMTSAKVANVIGTMRWAAPEILKLGKYTAAADVYSYGMVLWYFH